MLVSTDMPCESWRQRPCAVSRSRSFPARPGNQLTLAIGADALHLSRAVRAKRALVGTDRGFRIDGQKPAAPFARRFHE